MKSNLQPINIFPPGPCLIRDGGIKWQTALKTEDPLLSNIDSLYRLLQVTEAYAKKDLQKARHEKYLLPTCNYDH